MENAIAGPPRSACDMPVGKKIVIIMLGATLMGVTWRIRGSYSFGSFWGMLVVGTTYCLFLYMTFGESRKLSKGLIGLLVASMAATVGGWGTIVGQVTGRVMSYGHGNAAAYDVPVNPAMGWIWVFLIGLGWIPLFGFLIAQVFSEKEYEIKDYILVIVVFYAAMYLGELVLSHLFIPLMSPDAYELYTDSLGGTSPWLDYVSNFKDAGYYDSIAGGRNYAAMVSNFSSSFGALVLFSWIRWKAKDSKTARLYLGIVLVMGIAMSVANLWQFWGRGCLYDFGMQAGSCEAPAWLSSDHWSLWEFTTGFLAGLGITALLVNTRLPAKREFNHHLVPRRWERYFVAFGTIGLALGASVIRPLASRTGTHLPGSSLDLVVYVVGFGVLLVVAGVYLARTRGASALDHDTRLALATARTLTMVYIITYTVIDLFLREDVATPFLFVHTWLILLGCVASVVLVPLVHWWRTSLPRGDAGAPSH